MSELTELKPISKYKAILGELEEKATKLKRKAEIAEMVYDMAREVP